MKTACTFLYLHRTKNTGKVSQLTCFFFFCFRKNKLLDTTSWGRYVIRHIILMWLRMFGYFQFTKWNLLLFSSYSGIEGDLVACVAMCSAVREKLCPALLHTYCAVDIVEGLDVDKEEFDKFSARYEHSVFKSRYKKENANGCFC